MQSIVIAVDGSEHALNAVRYATSLLAHNSRIHIHLLNVQLPFPSAISTFVSDEAIRSFHEDEGRKALEGAQELLEEEGIAHATNIAVGNPADCIVAYARERGCDHILMGTRGMSSFSNLLLGSVANRVLHLSEVPVILIPSPGIARDHDIPMHKLLGLSGS